METTIISGRPPLQTYKVQITDDFGVPKGYQQLTVSTVAVGLTIPAGATRAFIIVETAAIRYRDDGIDPTSTVGMPITIFSTIDIGNVTALAQFKAIRMDTDDATLNVSYYAR